MGANAISLLVLGVEFLLERDTELSSESLESLEILLILAFVLDLGADTCVDELVGLIIDIDELEEYDEPSKTRTAVGKSLTRRAARRAAERTSTEGTRS